jgi:hypothetical protein
MGGKYTKWPKNVINGHSIDKMAIKNYNFFHCETFQNLPKLGFLVWKHTIWQHWCEWTLWSSGHVSEQRDQKCFFFKTTKMFPKFIHKWALHTNVSRKQ